VKAWNEWKLNKIDRSKKKKRKTSDCTDAATLADDDHEACLMPLFADDGFIGPLAEEEEEESDDTSSEEEEAGEKKKKKKQKKTSQDKKEAELNAMNQQFREWYESLPYPIIIDSGAAESVLPKDWCPQAALLKGESYGKHYTAANGSHIKNRGEKIVSMVTAEGQWKNLKFQVCDVTRPLASVSKIVESGHTVVFNPSWKGGSYILNLQTREKTWLRQQDGVFVLDAKVAPAQWQARPSFAGQGR
jgi:uncharacterized Zn finger protein (UPF0148 family)